MNQAMKNYWYGIALLLGLLVISCNNESAEESAGIEQGDGAIASIIRNPVTADGPLDTVNVAKMVFSETEHDFGEVDAGAVIKHTFRFINEGTVPLIINQARSTCGCTVPSWPKEPIEPGEEGEIKVEFNTAGKKEVQKKPVTIFANTYPSETKVFVNGYVRAEETD